jgi:hypothetical protein
VAGHGIALASLIASPGLAHAAPPPASAGRLGSHAVIDQARTMAHWVVAKGDANGLPFLIIDKLEARVFAFDASGVLLRSAPALIGLAPGDVSPVGIGSKRLADITPTQRITPAGRFEAALGKNLAGAHHLVGRLRSGPLAAPRRHHQPRRAAPPAPRHAIGRGQPRLLRVHQRPDGLLR